MGLVSVAAYTNVVGPMQYMCLWSNGFSRKLINGADAPELFIRFLESQIDFIASEPKDNLPLGTYQYFSLFF